MLRFGKLWNGDGENEEVKWRGSSHVQMLGGEDKEEQIWSTGQCLGSWTCPGRHWNTTGCGRRKSVCRRRVCRPTQKQNSWKASEGCWLCLSRHRPHRGAQRGARRGARCAQKALADGRCGGRGLRGLAEWSPLPFACCHGRISTNGCHAQGSFVWMLPFSSSLTKGCSERPPAPRGYALKNQGLGVSQGTERRATEHGARLCVRADKSRDPQAEDRVASGSAFQIAVST